MTAIVYLPILTRALTTALLVVSASALAETLGPFWGALVACLPVSAGPAYVFLAMQHDADFVAASALSSFAANAGTGLLLILFGLQAARVPLWRNMATSVTVWLAASQGLRHIPWTPITALLLNLVVYGIGCSLLRTAKIVSAEPPTVAPKRWFDLPVRAGAVAVFVPAVVVASSAIGPEATGTAAVFPISLISLIVVVQPRIGAAASALLAANALRGMFGFGTMLLGLHLAIRPFGVVMALLIALGVSVFWSIGLLGLRNRVIPGAVDADLQEQANGRRHKSLFWRAAAPPTLRAIPTSLVDGRVINQGSWFYIRAATRRIHRNPDE